MTHPMSRILKDTVALLPLGLISLAHAAETVDTIDGPATGARQIIAVFALFAAGIALLYTATKWYRFTTGKREGDTLPTLGGCLGWTIGSLALFAASIAVFGVHNIDL